jgi:hypothetical protein
MELHELNIDYTRQYMVDVHGKKYPIKQQRGRYYIQHATGQLTVTSKVNEYTDWCFDYVFRGLGVRFPCPAIDYFIHRHRMGNRISAQDYKIKFGVKPQSL